MLAGRKTSGQRKRWSGEVTRRSNALDLEDGVFTLDSPVAIASSLEHSAETNRRRRGTAYQSAVSMLNFYINRAGKNLPRHAAVFWSGRGWRCARRLAPLRARKSAKAPLSTRPSLTL